MTPIRLTSDEWYEVAKFIEDLRGWLLATFDEDSATTRAIDDRLKTAAAGLHYLAETDPEGCIFAVRDAEEA